eukprot:TRINITY_DN106097_c0_g1_i1.p1 TRINITY_DN106097_c0_g1~~TRINITY_DN106097_c0_g1_i1.p1  ORF type:complete len:1234 (+),score=180.47 TRINITY_DN106097_c0_g1_i1:45-3746(+)
MEVPGGPRSRCRSRRVGFVVAAALVATSTCALLWPLRRASEPLKGTDDAANATKNSWRRFRFPWGRERRKKEKGWQKWLRHLHLPDIHNISVQNASVSQDTAGTSTQHGLPPSSVIDSTADYWAEWWRGWSERLGLREELLKDPVVELLRAAAPTEEERAQLQYQREWYYRDNNVFSVKLTLRLGLICFLMCLVSFEMILQGWLFGNLGLALVVPRLTFSPAKARELSLGPRAGVRQPGARRRMVRALVTGKVTCQLHQLFRRVLTLEEKDVLGAAGMDALVLLRFCALCGRFCALCCLWCLPLLPLYGAGGPAVASEAGETSLSLCSLSNLPAGSRGLWAVVPASYLCNLALCGLLWKEYEHFVKLRRTWLGGEDSHTFTLRTAGRRGTPPYTQVAEMSSTKAADVDEDELGVGPLGSSASIGPPPVVLPPTDKRQPQKPRRSPHPSESASPILSCQHADLDVDSIQVEWSRGITPPQLQGSFRGSCPSGDIPSPPVPPPLQIAQATQSASLDLVREQARRSVMFERIPPELRDAHELRVCLEELLGQGSVVSVAFAPPDARRLSQLLEERSSLIRTSSASPSTAADPFVGRAGRCALATVEERIGIRREEFGRAMAGHKPLAKFSGLATGPATFLSVASDEGPPLQPTAKAQRVICTNGRMLISQELHVDGIEEDPPDVAPAASPEDLGGGPSASHVYRRLGNSWSSSGLQRSHCAGWLSASLLAGRTAVMAVGAGIGAVSAVAKEVAGTSVRHLGDIVPRSAMGSALDTPAYNSALCTPFGGLCPGPQRHLSISNLRAGESSTAFVTFRTLQVTCLACQVVLDEDAFLSTELVAEPAPEPRDVIWHNVARHQAQLLVRHFAVEVALMLGLAFWSVPVSLLQVWCSLTRLSALFPWLQLPETVLSTGLETLVILYMPVLALLALLEVLPILLHRLALRYEGVKSWSALQMLTMRRYWRFQLATLGVTVLSGSVSYSLKTMLDNPSSILWELGQSAPHVSVYFLATVLSSALVVGPVSLLRLPLLMQLGWAALTSKFRQVLRLPASVMADSQHFVGAAAEDCLDTPPMAADHSALLLVVLVCVTYATISPLMLAAGALFFVLRWLVLALRYLYVHVPRFDSGGAFWYLLWDQALLALVLGDVTTLAAVALRSGYAQLPFLLPLPLLPVAFRMRAEFRFAEPSRRLSLRAARTLDAKMDTTLADRFPHDAYWHPALRHERHERSRALSSELQL